jgi:hypothetical protein
MAMACITALSQGPAPGQPRVKNGPSEPDWPAILDAHFGLRMWGDLANPVVRGEAESALGRFRKAGPGPVRFTPIMALGLEVKIEGGWYRIGENSQWIWNYQDKHTSQDLEKPVVRPVRMGSGAKLEFDPGDDTFGLAIRNNQFNDTVFTEPKLVTEKNPRLSAQPYKVMIYPERDRTTGQIIPNHYIIGWEYSTNDDFQDVVTRVENVRLVGREE